MFQVRRWLSIGVMVVALLVPGRVAAQEDFVRTVQSGDDELARGPITAFSTNLLFDLATVINLSMEVSVSQHMTFRLEGIFPWWTWNDKANALQINHLNLGARYWFGDNLFQGWYGGFSLGAGRFDLEPAKHGIRGWEAMLSLGGGYAVPVSDHVSFDFGLGLGPMYTRFDKYKEVSPGFRAVTDPGKHYLVFGPTDLHISLIYHFATAPR